MERDNCSKEKTLLQSERPPTSIDGVGAMEAVAVGGCGQSVDAMVPCSDKSGSDGSGVGVTCVGSAQESFTGGRRAQSPSRQPHSPFMS